MADETENTDTDSVSSSESCAQATWQEYERLPDTTEMRPWAPDVDMDRVSISEEDKERGHPKEGGMIARDKENHGDRWYIREEYFRRNFRTDPVDG